MLGAILAVFLLSVVSAQTASMLKINSFKAYVNGDKDSGTGDVKAEDTVEIEFDVENIFPKTGGLDIEDIEVTAFIDGIDGDDGLDPDDEPDEFDLEPGDEESVTLEFSIPLEVEDKSFDLKIEVRGTDTNNTVHTITEERTIKVDKETHELLLRRAELLTSNLKCSRNTQVDLNIVNIGTSKEDVVVRVTNVELGLAFQDSFEMDDDPFDSDSKYSKSIPLTVSKDAEASEYQINVRATYDKGGRFVEKNLPLNVEACEPAKPATQQQDTTVVVQQPPTTQPTVTQPVVVAQPDETAESASLFGGSMTLPLLIGLEGLVIIVAIVL